MLTSANTAKINLSRKVGLAPTLGVLGLAGDTAGGLRPGFQPARTDLVPAVDALTVAALVDTGQGGEDLFALAAGGIENRLGAVGFGQNGPRVGRVLRIAHACHRPGALTLQDGYRPVQVVAHLL